MGTPGGSLLGGFHRQTPIMIDPWWSRFWNIPDWIPLLILCEGVHLSMPAEVFVSMQLLIVVSVVPGMWHCIWVRIQPACKRWDMVGWCFVCQFSQEICWHESLADTRWDRAQATGVGRCLWLLHCNQRCCKQLAYVMAAVGGSTGHWCCQRCAAIYSCNTHTGTCIVLDRLL